MSISPGIPLSACDCVCVRKVMPHRRWLCQCPSAELCPVCAYPLSCVLCAKPRMHAEAHD
eukprot:193869-Alexandrium_andersonii.AAC.1